MNKRYIVEIQFDQFANIPVEIVAESGELALNQAQGMLHGEWVNIVGMDGHVIRVRPERVVMMRIAEVIED